MSLLEPRDIEELIIAALVPGELRTTKLLAAIEPQKTITKQGFYAALRKLEAAEVVTIYQKTVALNIAWVKRLMDFAQEVEATYLPSGEGAEVLGLGEKESVTYSFNTTQRLDTFWGHTQSLLVAQTPATEPVYTYDPHYWFYLARPVTEKKIVDDIAKSGRQFLMTAGDDAPLDQLLRKYFADDYRQYHIERLFPDNQYYVVVVGNYVTEAWLDEHVVRGVDKIYRESSEMGEIVEQEFAKLLTQKARHKLRITKNARKARALKAKLGKNFFIKKL